MSDRNDTAARLAALEARLAALEARLGPLAPEQLTAHTLDSIWAHLERHGLAGFPPPVREGLVAATLDSIWAHLEQHGLAGVPERARQALGAGAPRPALEEDDLKRLSDRLVLSATRPIMKAIDSRLATLQAGPPPSDAADASGSAERELEAALLERLDRLEERVLGAADPGGRPTGGYDRRFIALAREVKQLKERVDGLTGAGPLDPGLAAVLDERFAALRGWVRDELVPGALRGGTPSPEA